MDVKKRQLIILLVIITTILTSSLIIWKTEMFFGEKYPVSMTDALNRSVTIEEKPQRIVLTSPAITELLFALQLDDKIIGVTDQCDYPPQVIQMRDEGKIESIGGYWNPNLEKIVSLNPDLVLVSAGVESHIQLVEQLESLNITVVALYPGKTISEIYENIHLVGEITDKKSDAEKLINNMTKRINTVQSAISEAKSKPSVLFVLWLEPVYTCGNDTFMSEVMYLAGGRNLFEDLSGWPTVSVEEIADRQPDVILITATMMMQSPEEILQSLQDNPLWNSTPAVKNNRVYILLGQGENIFVRPSVRIVEAVELLAEILYPEIFNVQIPNIVGDDYTNYLPSATFVASSTLV